MPMSIRLTARQHHLLQKMAKLFTKQNREGAPFSPEVTPVEALRMSIMMTAYSLDLIELNDEPQGSFELPSGVRKSKKKPKR